MKIPINLFGLTKVNSADIHRKESSHSDTTTQEVLTTNFKLSLEEHN